MEVYIGTNFWEEIFIIFDVFILLSSTSNSKNLFYQNTQTGKHCIERCSLTHCNNKIWKQHCYLQWVSPQAGRKMAAAYSGIKFKHTNNQRRKSVFLWLFQELKNFPEPPSRLPFLPHWTKLGDTNRSKPTASKKSSFTLGLRFSNIFKRFLLNYS